MKERLHQVWVNVFGQKKLMKDKKSGIIHTMLFYGFLFVQVGAIDFIYKGLNPGAHLPAFTITLNRRMNCFKEQIKASVWLKENLFSNWFNSVLTVLSVILVIFVLNGTLTWVEFIRYLISMNINSQQ